MAGPVAVFAMCLLAPLSAEHAQAGTPVPPGRGIWPVIVLGEPDLVVPWGDGRSIRLSVGVGTLTDDGRLAGQSLPDGGAYRRRTLKDAAGDRCRISERFRPTATGVRWEIAILGGAAPWSAPIEARLRVNHPDGLRMWTAWGDSRARPDGTWVDPLAPVPLGDLALSYGGASIDRADAFSLPIACLLDPASGAGLSLVQSPESNLLDVGLSFSASGGVTFRYTNHRISSRTPVRLALDLVLHEADWRAGLGWMVHRYPRFFDPPNALAYEVAGLGAYSTYEGPPDAMRLARMGFRANWKASYDFPYMGMFLPPLEGNAEWDRFGGGRTSTARMRAYSQQMRRLGFHVLNYFNITEFGANLSYPPPPPHTRSFDDLWRNANDYLYGRLRNAVLPGLDGNPLWTWGNAVAVDPGEPEYQAFLVRQAMRHIAELPDSSGICIDRMDWLRLYNPRFDDGRSWVNGRPARSLVNSWKSAMDVLGPVMHRSGKVIFGNTLDHRLDVMAEVDGIYDEFSVNPASLNQCALLAVSKPMMGWVNDASNLRPDPDAYLQRYLYLGVFPTAPYPQNDHTINPSAWGDQFFLDYGPLFDALRGRRWLLRPGVVEVEGGAARANVFAVPSGLVVAVVHGGNASHARVRLRADQELREWGGWHVTVLHPGDGYDRPKQLPWERTSDGLLLDVPLVRGCAVVEVAYSELLPRLRHFTREARIEMPTWVPGGEVRFTTDDTAPTPSSAKYVHPFAIRATTRIRMAAFRNGRLVGSVCGAEFVKVPPAAPRIDPPGGPLERTAMVRITAEGDDSGLVRYTLDGSDPKESSPRYTAPLAIAGTVVIKARVLGPGLQPSPIAAATFAALPPEPALPDVSLSTLEPLRASVGWGGSAKRDRSIQGAALSVAGRVYTHGMGVHATSELAYALRPGYRSFVATVGVDDEMHDYRESSVVFRVLVDGKLLAESPVLRLGWPWRFAMPLPDGGREISLVVTDAGDGMNCDHADWVNAGFTTR